MKYRIVPVEMTDGMLDECNHSEPGEFGPYIEGPWADIITAAPRASEDEALVEMVAETLCVHGGNGWGDVPDLHHVYEGYARAVLRALEGGGE